ncbi:Uncharacterised protein [Mycobacteroides abscessus subsp. abscessus]|nr:Uncharacterised protein [Mycobacteroides abscessus subsp. abscessus]
MEGDQVVWSKPSVAYSCSAVSVAQGSYESSSSIGMIAVISSAGMSS